jgi:hypothetical protein
MKKTIFAAAMALLIVIGTTNSAAQPRYTPPDPCITCTMEPPDPCIVAQVVFGLLFPF